ncbi:winged helix-turn-helix domain-containing protein [Caulobacter sp. 602-1]|uniref:winged helix-turn-helix domain-containing protein n=1 Tax=Caulobacter sp. 602-1 TaxID=2492472 RepID=UPI0013156C53|nr:winged helix-turn-helix domain-containing protein [Caulobacter sp. 602-1]
MGASLEIQAFCEPHDTGAPEPDPADATARSIRFGEFEIVPAARALVRNGVSIEIGSRAFDILMVLLAARGRIVCKERLIREVWPTTTVVDSNLKVQLSLLRRVLGTERWRIKTVSGRGYLIVVDEAAELAPFESREPGAAAGEGPLIIVIEAQPGTRELMAQAILDLTRSFFAEGGPSAPVSAVP